MTHWGWYWKIKKKYVPKPLCSNLISIDSAAMFKIKEAESFCMNKVVLEIPAFHLTATLLTNSYSVSFDSGCYNILIERQACHFGGYRHYFYCPRCNCRMRILYCAQGLFLCRKCINAGYISQRRLSYRRNIAQQDKIEKYLGLRGESVFIKPKGMHWKTFYRLQACYSDYQAVAEDAVYNDIKTWRATKKIFGGSEMFF